MRLVLNHTIPRILLLASLGSGLLEELKDFFGWLGGVFGLFLPVFGIFTVIFISLMVVLFPLLDEHKGALEEAGAEILARHVIRNLRFLAPIMLLS